MGNSHSIYSDQKQVRSLAGQASGVCYALVPGHHGQGGRHVPVVGKMPMFSRLLAKCLTTIVPSLELAGGFGSRSFLAIFSYRPRDSNSPAIGGRNLVTGCARFARQTRARLGRHQDGQFSLADGVGRGVPSAASPTIGHSQVQHQLIHYVTDAVHSLSRLSFRRLESTQHGLDRKVWRYPIQIIRCPL